MEPLRHSTFRFPQRDREVCGRARGRLVDDRGVLALALADQHRDVGMPEQIVGCLREAGRLGPHDTHAGGDPHRRALHHEGAAQSQAQPICDLVEAVPVSAGQHRELVTADARQRVTVSQASAEATTDRAEQLVTGGVTVSIVDLLEVVEVDEDQHEVPVPGRPLEPLGEQDPVGQTGQRIMAHRPVQPTGQRPLGTRHQNLTNGHQENHEHGPVRGEQSQGSAGHDVECEQHRRAEEAGVGQDQPHPVGAAVGEVAVGVALRGAQQRVGDHPLPGDETDTAPQGAAVDTDELEVHPDAIRRGDRDDVDR